MDLADQDVKKLVSLVPGKKLAPVLVLLVQLVVLTSAKMASGLAMWMGFVLVGTVLLEKITSCMHGAMGGTKMVRRN